MFLHHFKNLKATLAYLEGFIFKFLVCSNTIAYIAPFADHLGEKDIHFREV